jgi:lipid A 3-O-deacylase
MGPSYLFTAVLFLRRLVFFSIALFAFTGPAYAIDSLSLELGSGNKTGLVRAGVQWNWESQWNISENARLSGLWDVSLAQWRGRRHKDQEGNDQDLLALGISPVLRLTGREIVGPYFETGLGPHLLSEKYDNNRRQLSTRFQFGSHLGLGYIFPNGLDIALRFQHYSNASIKKPNDGVNFLILRFSYPL